jgi:hypothetical protein
MEEWQTFKTTFITDFSYRLIGFNQKLGRGIDTVFVKETEKRLIHYLAKET